jgi:hypothetical protein
MGARTMLRGLAGFGLLCAGVIAMALPSAAATITIPGSNPTASFTPVSGSPPPVCTGTDAAPGQLAGNYTSNVSISGTCWVNGGVADIQGNLTIDPGSTLNATFARDDNPGGTGASALYVSGNVYVETGATLVLGCEPNEQPCSDDPDAANGGTLGTLDIIGGSLLASQPLGVIVHHAIVMGSVEELGSTGGPSCIPPATGIFASMQSPVFSDFEDNWIVGNLSVDGLSTCWTGALRNHIGGSLSDIGNTWGDPDSNEFISNVIEGDASCSGNSPQVQFGDSMGVPNQVGEIATGECAFSTTQPNPAANEPGVGDSSPPYYPAGPPQPISVPA